MNTRTKEKLSYQHLQLFLFKPPLRKQNWNIYQLKFTATLKTKQTHTFRRVMEQKINLKTKIIPVIVEWSENIKLWKTHSQNAERKALKYPRKNASATTKIKQNKISAMWGGEWIKKKLKKWKERWRNRKKCITKNH